MVGGFVISLPFPHLHTSIVIKLHSLSFTSSAHHHHVDCNPSPQQTSILCREVNIIEMIGSNDTYRRNYLPKLRDTAVDHQRNTSFNVADPMMENFSNIMNLPAANGKLHTEHSGSTFIPEPRVSAVRLPKLPLFFSQSQAFPNNEVPLQPSNSYHDESPLKPTKGQFMSPSSLQLQPSLMSEKATGNRLGSRLNAHANGIMSENVQQRYLFSKNPNYGPLSIPVTTTYHPATSNAHNIQDGGFFNREESQNYNYKIRSFGRRSSDAREPMPKLGQGDARLGDGILFGEKKTNVHSSLRLLTPSKSKDKVSDFHPTAAYKIPASPPSLTYSSYSPKSPISSHRPQADSSRLGVRNIGSKSPQRSPVPFPIGPVPEKFNRKLLGQPRTPPRTDKDRKSCIQGSYEEYQVHQMSTDKAPSLPDKAHAAPETATKLAPTGPKKMASSYQLNATAAEFQPASLRARPSKWRIQCKWTFEHVENCRYGPMCHWGHEGDEYFDAPGVKHTFKGIVPGGDVHYEEANDQVCYDQIHYENFRHDQVAQYDPSEFSAYSASSSHPAQQNPNYGFHQYIDGCMPNFSWVGGATNVDGWLGAQDINNHPVYEYIDSQAQNPASLHGAVPVYDSANVYGNFHPQGQPENPSTSGGSIKKKYKKKKNITKHWEDKMKKEAVLAVGQIEGHSQDSHAENIGHEKKSEPQFQSPHVEVTKPEECAAETMAARTGTAII